METSIQNTTSRRGERRIGQYVESFTTPGTYYTATFYLDSHGVVIGGSCDCRAHVAPLKDKHVLYLIAESYGAEPPRAGAWSTPAFFEELEELTGVSYCDLSQAFTMERRNTAITVLKAAVLIDRHGDGESRGDFVRGWARRWSRGNYHPAIVGQPVGLGA